MAQLILVHWHQEEAEHRAAALRAVGHDVQVHWSQSERWTADRDRLPDGLVISLDRLPSHGRAVAEWWVEAKYRRERPLVFVDGAPEKVAAIREKFPDAHYGASSDLPGLLERLGLGAGQGVPS